MNGLADQTAARPTIATVLSLYAQRDQLASKEQEVEEEIFGGSQKSVPQADELLARYRAVKLQRMELSLRAAYLFMLLTPSEKMEVTASWTQTKAGKGKKEGSGVKGIPTINMGVF